MSSPLRISVVIATYNRRTILARTLPTLFAQDFPHDDYEVIVVVDGSTDGTLGFLHNLKSSSALHVLQQPNRGQAAARNQGLRAARGELVLFLDDDILCERTLLREHAAAHQGGSPRLVFRPVHVARDSLPTLATDWARACTDGYLARLAWEREPRWPDDAMVDANSSAPRATLLACGGFDESFYGAQEDGELGVRLWKAGVRFQYQPAAVTHQLYVKSARELVSNDTKWYGKNEVRLCRKHPDCRIYSPLAQLSEGPLWKRLRREVAMWSSVSLEPLLRAPFWVAERLRSVPQIRRTGIRLLQARQAIVMYRSVVREVGSHRALRAEFGMHLPVLLYHRVEPRGRVLIPS